MEKYKRNDSFVLRNIMNTNMLFPTGESIQLYQGAITLNSVATVIWNSMNQYVSVDYLAEIITAEFEIDTETARKDTLNLLKVLLDKKIIFAKTFSID